MAIPLSEIQSAIIQVYRKSEDDHLSIHAASLAFTTVLALVPVLALAYFIFDALGGLQKLEIRMEPFIMENLAPAFGSEIMGYVSQVHQRVSGGAIGIFGFFGFLYTSLAMLFKIEFSFNHIWGIKSNRSLVRRITNYWAMITLGPIVFGTSLYCSSMVYGWLSTDGGEISKILIFFGALIPYLTTAFLFTAMYVVLPNSPVGIRPAAVAGLIAGSAFEIAKLGYAYYATHTLGVSIYGAIAVLPVFLLWVQLAWLVVLYGAELCHGLQQMKSFRPEGRVAP
jgi:membrane protein